MRVEEKYDLFAGHAWGDGGANHARVPTIVAKLRSLGYKVWFDSDRLTGDIAGQITNGLKKSNVFLTCITKGYMERIENALTRRGTDWCDYEFQAALVSHGRNYMMVVVMDDDVRDVKTWFGPIGSALSSTACTSISRRTTS